MICKDVTYVGVNDHDIDLFEGQYAVPAGMAYNSYIIEDDKIAVLDSTDAAFTNEWLKNVENVLNGRAPSYLIVSHMEPDHSSAIHAFVQKYPEAVVVATQKAFTMMGHYFSDDYAASRLVVKDGDSLSLGTHELVFITAPMVHWPEVMLTYDRTAKVLFSADAFGKFGALDVEEDWACEARRYYFGIVGKYGGQVQALFKKLDGVDVQIICPLHGPVLSENLGYYLDLYNTWSSYGVESDGVVICYTSVYGHTKEAVHRLEQELLAQGCPKVAVNDLARCDMAEAVEDAFRYGKLVLATTTYNGEVFPFMREFINELTERGYRNRTIGIVENGSWMPMAAKYIRKAFESSKDIAFTNTTVSILAAMKAENEEQIRALAAELA